MLYIEEFADANLSMHSQQHGAAQAHVFYPHDLRERACHPVNTPDAHRKFDSEPRLSAPVHALLIHCDHRTGCVGGKDRVSYSRVITCGYLKTSEVIGVRMENYGCRPMRNSCGGGGLPPTDGGGAPPPNPPPE